MLRSLLRAPASLLPRVSSLHTTGAVSGSWSIPDRLKHIPDADDPGFFEMVEYYFHKSW